MRNHRFSFKNVIILSLILTVFGGTMVVFSHLRPKPLRISVVALEEIMKQCQGGFHDLSANEDYVYANCFDGKPVTVQNYLFK